MPFCQEVISIVGPTASGKTALALNLATQKLADYPAGVRLISADSRQVYQEFPLLSGADLEEYRGLDPRIDVYGLGIISLDEEWSLGNFLDFAKPIIDEAREKNQLVMVVGGTLLYHQRLLTNNEQAEIPPNENIRAAADSLSVSELQNWLAQVSPESAAALNPSDFQNPRRLVRQIEIAIWRKMYPEKAGEAAEIKENTDFKHQFITPNYDKSALPGKIRARVEQRWRDGASAEVESVLASHPQLKHDSPTTATFISKMPLGFAEVRDFLLGKKSLPDTLEIWALHEWQYAKRQLKWPILTECQVV